VRLFRFGERTGIDRPREASGLPPTRAVKQNITRNVLKRRKSERKEPWSERDEQLAEREGRWTDYDMAASSFGQGTNASTPVQVLRYVGGLAMGGQFHTPHLMRRIASGYGRSGGWQPERGYQDPGRFTVPMDSKTWEIVKRGMWLAVNGSGTATAAAVAGFDVCGKTGTAQVASNDKAGEKNRDHAWFMSFAPRDQPEVAIVILTENAGFGGKQSAPRAKPIYEEYLRLSRPAPAETPIAQGPSSNEAPGLATRPSGRGPDRLE